MEPRVRPFGDAAVLVEFGDSPNLELNARVHTLAKAIDAAASPYVRDVVPGYVSLLVEFDPLATEPDTMERWIWARLAEIRPAAASAGRVRTVPTVYGGEWGPDLEEVANRVGLTPEEVIEAHTTTEQQVYMLGFSPGFPYLGDLPERLALPRRATPRERVPAGSVAIVERQTGIYSRETPGGWHLLGRTPLPLFDERRRRPAYLAPGDRVRFVAISAADWREYVEPPDDW
jgi:inhibitor of KinA